MREVLIWLWLFVATKQTNKQKDITQVPSPCPKSFPIHYVVHYFAGALRKSHNALQHASLWMWMRTLQNTHNAWGRVEGTGCREQCVGHHFGRVSSFLGNGHSVSLCNIVMSLRSVGVTSRGIPRCTSTGFCRCDVNVPCYGITVHHCDVPAFQHHLRSHVNHCDITEFQ